MTEISKKHLEQFKRIYKKEYNKDITDAEAYDMGHRLVNFAKLLLDLEWKEEARKKRLEKEPKGFHLTDGIYSCLICRQAIENKQTWYDKDGIKCMACQKALDDQVIPQYVCTNRDSWLADWQVRDKLDIHLATIRKMTREGKLKARTIYNEGGQKYFELFIIKENELLQKNTSKNETN